MQKRETNTGCNGALTGATARLTDNAVVSSGVPDGSNEGEEHRVTPLLSWKTIPTGFLTISDVEIMDEVTENGEEEEEV
ncbi:hypothetical protein [Natrialba sp. PRR66]|uniref:hypothetical protein n=1 Tax=Natrialba sp. PRR66 TaxID=3098146 RepID=UPI002B1E79F5|nr:hypothetical protein [Natrialba sp. PRR66]